MSGVAEVWASGTMVCLYCNAEHVGAWLIGSEPVECPYCSQMGCVPTDGIGFGEAQAFHEEHGGD